MLSRVAAVMAPRTHNRRVVTGSNGRRMEGRESEPQRPNMSHHVFTSAVLLLLVVIAFGGSDAAPADDSQESADPQFKWRGITDGETVDSLGAPSLLKVGSDVFAVAAAQWKKDDGSFTGIASQLLTKKTANTPEEVLKDAKDQTQLLEEGASEGQKKKVDVSRPTTVVEGSGIYMLVGQYGSKVASSGPDAKRDAAQLGLLLVKGSVSGEDTSNNKIVWKDTENPPQRLFGTQPDSWTRLIGSGGSGVRIKDGTFLFPVEGTKKKNEDADEDGKTVSLIIYSTDTTKWTLSKGMSDGGCSDPSVVEWEGKLMMMTACDDGRRRVYEIDDKGEEWTEALGTLSRVWGNKKGETVEIVGSGFITATIDGVEDNRNVMLVTLPVYSKENQKENGNEKGKLHLWLTDNTHIVDIGLVSDDDAAASSLLYKSGTGEDKKEELIALYEKKKEVEKPSLGMVSVLLAEKLQRVKDVLTTWKEADKRVSQLCTSLSAQKDRASTGYVCSAAVKITDGLVGFLSDKFSGDTWMDEYLGVNATIAENDGAVKAENGVKFTGRGAGAQWPVGKQGENQLYHFANYNFTLVATVSIHNVPEGNIPVMGVRVGKEGKTKLIELSYNSGKKWQVLCGDENSKELSSIGETETPQHVVILLRNGIQCTAYVDGQRMGDDVQCELGSGESNEISHFYIGGDGGSTENKESVSVTVTNVLLYNRPLDEAEITALNPNKASTPSPVDEPSQRTAIENSSGGGGKEEQGQLLGSSGTGGVSTSTVSSAKTSSGEEGSATQLVSEESFDGSKNVGGASSPGSDAAVETGDRSTVQGDGSSQTLVGTPATADAYAPNAETTGHDGTAVNPGASASSGEDGETAEGTDGREKEEIHAQNGDVKAAALSSSLGNVSHGNNSDTGTMRESGLLPLLLLLLLLGLWGFAAL
ncbi:trans-sialidase [Trypanosoma cruzi Dm28c]|uniref:Trans-sialidase n=2 Tax=Trypanosoma cruzi TaxID=5693 RepID=V5APD4_TRYCR|nr:trans-sialidase [Trypanosoma cruzi Dm28c]PBJ77334.1 trans-sialidase [Trypanosoma cruzi cruzi]PWU93418.1 putative trans-sialidase, Group V [Trypanosoma cruzi]